jgi:hypothetical protein
MQIFERSNGTRHRLLYPASVLGLFPVALVLLLVQLQTSHAFTILHPEEVKISSPPFLWYKSVQVPLEGATLLPRKTFFPLGTLSRVLFLAFAAA